MIETVERRVTWRDGESVTTLTYGSGDTELVFAHGAGTGQRHRLVADFARRMAELEVTTTTFDYPFTEANRRRPDGVGTLLTCHRSVVEAVSGGRPVVLGGRSMGGRMASMLVAGVDGSPVPCRGLVLHAYPLHPAGRPERLRVEHLDAIRVPMLIARGSRDALSRSEVFDEHLRYRNDVDVIDLNEVDHSFRGKNVVHDELMDRLARAAIAWMDGLAPTLDG